MHVDIPWGTGETLGVRIPDNWSVEGVHLPDLSEPVGDYSASLTGALRVAGLSDLVCAGTRVAIVVDDASRWTPVREALPIILDCLHAAAVRRDDISITVAVGRHRPMAQSAIADRVGHRIHSMYRCFSPPVDDARFYADLGTTPENIRVRVFRPVAEAGVRILVGSVLPHMQAGFGGGWKLIFPGTSHRTTLGALHGHGLDGDMARLLGTAASDNPMRRAVRSAARLLEGSTFSVSHILGQPGTVLKVLAGAPDEVQDLLAAEVCRRFAAPPAAPVDIVVAANYPWPGDPMQSFKVLFQHRSACRRGGVLAGFFWTDPDEIDRSVPLTVLRAVAATGAIGGWAVRRGIAAATPLLSTQAKFMAHWARELVVDGAVLLYAPTLHARLGSRLGPVRLFADEASLWKAAEHVLTIPKPSVRIFPAGGLTYCRKN